MKKEREGDELSGDLFSDRDAIDHFNSRSKVAPLHGGPCAQQLHTAGSKKKSHTPHAASPKGDLRRSMLQQHLYEQAKEQVKFVASTVTESNDRNRNSGYSHTSALQAEENIYVAEKSLRATRGVPRVGRPSTSASSVTTDKETMAILSKVDNDVKERIIEKMDSERLASSVRLTAANANLKEVQELTRNNERLVEGEMLSTRNALVAVDVNMNFKEREKAVDLATSYIPVFLWFARANKEKEFVMYCWKLDHSSAPRDATLSFGALLLFVASSLGSLDTVSETTWITGSALFVLTVVSLGYVYTNLAKNIGQAGGTNICKTSQWGLLYFQIAALCSFSILYTVPFFVTQSNEGSRDAQADDLSMRTIVLAGSNLLFITIMHTSFALAKHWSSFLVLISLAMHMVVVPIAVTGSRSLNVSSAAPTFAFTVLLHIVMALIFREAASQQRFIWSELAGARQAIITGRRRLEKQLEGVKRRRISSTHFVMKKPSYDSALNMKQMLGSPMETVIDFVEGLAFEAPQMQKRLAAVRHILSSVNTRNLFTPDLKSHFSSNDLSEFSKSGRSIRSADPYTEETKAWLNQQLIEDQLDEVTREIKDLDEELDLDCSSSTKHKINSTVRRERIINNEDEEDDDQSAFRPGVLDETPEKTKSRTRGMTSLVLPPSSDDSEDAKIRNSDGSFKKKPIWKISRLATYDSKRQIRTKAMPVSSETVVVPLKNVAQKSAKRQHVEDVFQFLQDHGETTTALMKEFGNWDFDVIELDRVSMGNALYIVGMKGVTKLVGMGDIGEDIVYDKMMLQRFLLGVQDAYLGVDKVPYHNYMHGADVSASVYYFMRKKVSQEILSQVELFGGIIAALVHDIGHPGVNNKFLVASNNRLAIDYNDESVLENMHCALCFRLSMKDGHKIFDALPDSKYRAVRLLIIKMVLDTDLANHFESLGQFKSRMTSLESKLTNDAERSSLPALLTAEDKFMILRMMLKTADIGHAAKQWTFHQEWSTRITEEFHMQGDLEKSRNMKVSPLCDRDTCNMSNSQVGFIDFLVLPLFETSARFFDFDTKDMRNIVYMNNVLQNKEHWQNMSKHESKRLSLAGHRNSGSKLPVPLENENE